QPILTVCRYDSSPVNTGDPELIDWLREHGADEDTIDRGRNALQVVESNHGEQIKVNFLPC
ncbi:hypothetical protein scyTo_0020716, partial [Scyliorhinus torazame]|nr:hypothetical protein [Scyliorhinus torazame]